MITTRALRGFTLLELLIVIAIIGILAGMGITVYPMVITHAKKQQARTTIKNLELALAAYKSDFGIYPNDETPEGVMNDLTGFCAEPNAKDPKYNDPEWNGPYYQGDAKNFEFGMRNKALLDPWMNKYQFSLSEPVHNPFSIDIWSAGPNRKDEKGGGDDITNWK